MSFSSARSAPLYVRLADQLREGILSGQWHPGDTLPSEPELCALHGVSRGTVVKAIDLLIHDGLVQRKQGSGTFVSKPSLHRQPGFLLSFSEAIRQQERVPTQQLLELTRLTAAQAREYGSTSPMVRLLRLRLVDGVPCAIHDCVLPHNVSPFELDDTRVDALFSNAQRTPSIIPRQFLVSQISVDLLAPCAESLGRYSCYQMVR